MSAARILLVTGSRVLEGSAQEADAHDLLRAFAKIAAIIVTNSTEDPTALLWADTGATNGWVAPYSGWRAFCYGLDAKGGNFPCPVVNMNTNTSFDWDVVASTTDSINLNSNTPATATTLTGRLIIIGWV